jgi:hypothetical protein|tara:strand:- start:1488 stop:1760 length:273 start_codon:yes stop_codon:yes gene_type:complete
MATNVTLTVVTVLKDPASGGQEFWNNDSARSLYLKQSEIIGASAYYSQVNGKVLPGIIQIMINNVLTIPGSVLTVTDSMETIMAYMDANP